MNEESTRSRNKSEHINKTAENKLLKGWERGISSDPPFAFILE